MAKQTGSGGRVATVHAPTAPRSRPAGAGGRTVAVFTRLTEPDLRTLRHLARLQGTTASSIIRELTESWIAHEREARRTKAAGDGGTKTNRKASK